MMPMITTLEKHAKPIFPSDDLEPALRNTLSELAGRVFPEPHARGRQSILVTSCDPRAGVSFLSACLALVLSDSKEKVLLLSARRLNDLVSGRQAIFEEDIVCSAGSPVWILNDKAAGQRRPLLSPSRSQTVERSFPDLKERFRYIVIDAPALSVAATAIALADTVDGVLLVAVPGLTQLQDIVAARKRIERAGGRVIGGVINPAAAGAADEMRMRVL